MFALQSPIKKVNAVPATSAAPTDLEKEVKKLREELRKAHNIKPTVSDDDLLNEARQKRLDDAADFSRATAANPLLAAAARNIGATDNKDLARGLFAMVEARDREARLVVDRNADYEAQIKSLEVLITSLRGQITSLTTELENAKADPVLQTKNKNLEKQVEALNDLNADLMKSIDVLKAAIKSLNEDLVTEQKLSSHYHAEIKRMAKDNESKNAALVSEFKRQLALVAATNTTVTHTDDQTAARLKEETERADKLATVVDGLQSELKKQADEFAVNLKGATKSRDDAIGKIIESTDKAMALVTAALNRSGNNGGNRNNNRSGNQNNQGNQQQGNNNP